MLFVTWVVLLLRCLVVVFAMWVWCLVFYCVVCVVICVDFLVWVVLLIALD